MKKLVFAGVVVVAATASFAQGAGRKVFKPGETGKAVIALNSESFEYYDPSIDELSPRPGRYQILYGSSSLDKDLQTLDFVLK